MTATIAKLLPALPLAAMLAVCAPPAPPPVAPAPPAAPPAVPPAGAPSRAQLPPPPASAPAPTAAPSSSELTSQTVEAANRALAQIPKRLLEPYQGQFRYTPTNWDDIYQRSAQSSSLRAMLAQLNRMAVKAFEAPRDRYVRPMTFAQIPKDMLYTATLDIKPIERRDLNQLANVDGIQTSFLMTQGVTLAIIAKRLQNQEYLGRCVEMLEALNAYRPLQRPGNTYGDEKVPMTPDGDGVWLATAWGIGAMVDMMSILGSDVPAPLRARLERQLRDEVRRICVDWADKRPWFTKSRKVQSNQWIEPNVALIKACLFLADDQLRPAYELGAENLAATLAELGADGSYNEGVSYAEMTLGRLHEALGWMRASGDGRCSTSPFAQRNWFWFTQMLMPGRMLVNSYDSGMSELPEGAVDVPLASMGVAALATTDPDAVPTMKFLYPAPKANFSLDAIKFAAALDAQPGVPKLRVPNFAYFPNQQQVVWRSEFQPPSAAQTAWGLWVRGGSLTDNHCQRDQGQVSVYCGDRPILLDCGTGDYGTPDYTNVFSAAAGHNVLQVGPAQPNSMPVDAPITVSTLDDSGGKVSVNCTRGFTGAETWVRGVEWTRDGRVAIKDGIKLRNAAPAGTEILRFHTGSDAPLSISGEGNTWSVSWLGAQMRLVSDVPLQVSQSTVVDRVLKGRQHQAVIVRCAAPAQAANVATSLEVETRAAR